MSSTRPTSSWPTFEKRTASLKESIAKNEGDRAALSQAEADLLKTDHRIELAEGLSADCRQLLSQLQDADKRPGRTPQTARPPM